MTATEDRVTRTLADHGYTARSIVGPDENGDHAVLTTEGTPIIVYGSGGMDVAACSWRELQAAV